MNYGIAIARKAAISVMACCCLCGIACGEEKEKAAKDTLGGVSVIVPPLGTGSFRIPKRESIRKVYVELFNSSITLSDIPPFQVEEKYIDRIYKYVQDAHIDRQPNVVYPDVGTVRCVLDNDEVINISIHRLLSDGLLQFSIMGVRLEQDRQNGRDNGGAISFELLIRRIYYWQSGHCTFGLPQDVIRKLNLEEP